MIREQVTYQRETRCTRSASITRGAGREKLAGDLWRDRAVRRSSARSDLRKNRVTPVVCGKNNLQQSQSLSSGRDMHVDSRRMAEVMSPVASAATSSGVDSRPVGAPPMLASTFFRAVAGYRGTRDRVGHAAFAQPEAVFTGARGDGVRPDPLAIELLCQGFREVQRCLGRSIVQDAAIRLEKGVTDAMLMIAPGAVSSSSAAPPASSERRRRSSSVETRRIPHRWSPGSCRCIRTDASPRR